MKRLIADLTLIFQQFIKRLLYWSVSEIYSKFLLIESRTKLFVEHSEGKNVSWENHLEFDMDERRHFFLFWDVQFTLLISRRHIMHSFFMHNTLILVEHSEKIGNIENCFWRYQRIATEDFLTDQVANIQLNWQK